MKTLIVKLKVVIKVDDVNDTQEVVEATFDKISDLYADSRLVDIIDLDNDDDEVLDSDDEYY